MITLLHPLSYVGALAAFLFITLSLASGLLWLAELIEEHSRYAKVIGMRAIYTIITLHILLLVTDDLPLLPSLLSILCHLVYLSNFSSTWPFISLTSLRFILSCLLVVADHFTWFFHFAAKAQEAKRFRGPKYRYGSGQVKDDSPVFMDVAAFFAICVWSVPLFLFLSLSANDNALPSFDSSTPTTPGGANAIDLATPLGGPPSYRQARARSSTSLLKSILVPIISLLPRLRTRRRNDEGIIAPRTPVRGSPLHSPVDMPQTYFPWGNDLPPSSNTPNQSKYPSNLAPNSAIGRPFKMNPPRRVQSEIQVSKGIANPRGLATREGKPVVTDAQLMEEAGEIVSTVGMSSGRVDSSSRPSSPSMSLGSRGLDLLGGAELVDSQIRPRSKAD
ncbi:MAG: hypothetical protein TREMPRED_001498 [Tremellales sp. Tagirdzhanova-0007]|nr:MAG: hypothetical protein TREMPRED_001498 [Tremellales sp. Tagirdzhanova-0007]